MEDNSESQKLDHYLEKCGNKNRYQFISVLIIFFIYGTSEFIAISLPLLEINPIVSYLNPETNSIITTQSTYKLCNDSITNNFELIILTDKSKSSIVTDFKIYCDQNKVSLIGSSLFIGVMLGSFLSYFFSDKMGRKKTAILFSFLYCINQALFILVNNLYLLYLLLFLSGFFYSIIVLTLIVLMNEVIDIQLTAIFTTTIHNAYPFCGIIYTLMFKNLNDWRIIFVFSCIIHFCFTMVLTFYIEESPRFYFSNKNLPELKKVLSNIAKKNKLVFEAYEINTIFEKPEKKEENTDDEERLFKIKKKMSFVNGEEIYILFF